jgi:hypothetical protein
MELQSCYCFSAVMLLCLMGFLVYLVGVPDYWRSKPHRFATLSGSQAEDVAISYIIFSKILEFMYSHRLLSKLITLVQYLCRQMPQA